MEFKILLFAIILSRSHFCKGTASSVPVCEKDGPDDTVKSCCPVPADRCPDNFQIVNKTVVCESNNDTDTTATTVAALTTTITPDVPSNSTNDTETLLDGMDSGEDEVDLVSVCERCGEYDHFNNITRKCDKCDPTCLICDKMDLDTSNCTVCFIEHEDECYSDCPDGTVLGDRKTANGSSLCDKEADEGIPIAIIAGAAAGGVVLIVIIIVIVCCCCCCRRRKRKEQVDGKTRTAMSLIIDQNNENANIIQETGNKPSRQRRNYENMDTKLPGQEEIANQADGLGRYIRDPTTVPKQKQRGRTNEPDRTSDPYANNAMVRLARNTDLTSVDSSKLEAMVEKEELEELGLAPVAPAIPVQPSTLQIPTPAKSNKTGLVKRLSQRMTKLAKGKSKASNENVTEPSGADDGLEDYENITFSDVKKGRKAQPAPAADRVTQPAPAADRDNQPAPAADGETTQEEGGMEIYENVKQSSAENDSLDDLDDYENTKNLHKTEHVLPETAGSAMEAEGDMEDYENIKGLETYENFDFNQVKGRKAKY